MSNPAPVTDWVHDFDHTDPRWTENPFPIWDECFCLMAAAQLRARAWHAAYPAG